jgi:Holliday junction resolvasome RuvABC endonuclease subunit
MNILALDPAPMCGFAHSNGRHGVWQLSASAQEHRGNRLVRLYEHVEEAFYEWGVDKLVFENASLGAGSYENAKTAHNEIRGVLLFAAARFKIPWAVVNPLTLKKFATGNGHASKSQMVAAARTRLEIKVDSDDEADALWILALAETEDLEATKRKTAQRQERQTRRERLHQEKMF